MENQEKTQKIIQQIFDDAKRKGDRVISKANRQAQKMVHDARKQADDVKSKSVKNAHLEADKTYEKILSSIPLEEKNIRLTEKDKIVQEIIDQIRQELENRNNLDHRQILKKLAISAMEKMPVNDFVIACSSADKPIFTEEFISEVIQEFSRGITIEVADEAEDIIGGVRIRDKSGRLFYDNSFDARILRLYPQLRQKIAEIVF